MKKKEGPGDTRIAPEIFFDGFKAKGTNMNLLDHVYSEMPASGFISTSKSSKAALPEHGFSVLNPNWEP